LLPRGGLLPRDPFLVNNSLPLRLPIPVNVSQLTIAYP
jgi:hypothetical protein